MSDTMTCPWCESELERFGADDHCLRCPNWRWGDGIHPTDAELYADKWAYGPKKGQQVRNTRKRPDD